MRKPRKEKNWIKFARDYRRSSLLPSLSHTHITIERVFSQWSRQGGWLPAEGSRWRQVTAKGATPSSIPLRHPPLKRIQVCAFVCNLLFSFFNFFFSIYSKYVVAQFVETNYHGVLNAVKWWCWWWWWWLFTHVSFRFIFNREGDGGRESATFNHLTTNAQTPSHLNEACAEMCRNWWKRSLADLLLVICALAWLPAPCLRVCLGWVSWQKALTLGFSGVQTLARARVFGSLHPHFKVHAPRSLVASLPPSFIVSVFIKVYRRFFCSILFIIIIFYYCLTCNVTSTAVAACCLFEYPVLVVGCWRRSLAACQPSSLAGVGFDDDDDNDNGGRVVHATAAAWIKYGTKAAVAFTTCLPYYLYFYYC